MRSSHALRVVLIEDNEADVFLIEESLREHGIDFDLVRYSNGDEAIRDLCRENPGVEKPELVLLDLHLPGKEGPEILRALRDERRMRNVPIVIISGTPGPQLEGLDLTGADRIVAKSMDLADYLRNVGRAVLELAQRFDRRTDAQQAS